MARTSPEQFPDRNECFVLSESECHVTVTHTKARPELHETGTCSIAAVETITERVK